VTIATRDVRRQKDNLFKSSLDGSFARKEGGPYISRCHDVVAKVTAQLLRGLRETPCLLFLFPLPRVRGLAACVSHSVAHHKVGIKAEGRVDGDLLGGINQNQAVVAKVDTEEKREKR